LESDLDHRIVYSICMEQTEQVGNSRSSRPEVSKLVRAVTQITVVIISYYPQYFAVIAHNAE